MRAQANAPEFDPESILYHANGFLIVDKPTGVLAHGTAQDEFGLAEAIKNWASMNVGLLDLGSGGRIHPLTLLEREASGVFLMALSRKATRLYREAESKVVRHCLAVVAGPMPADGEIRGRVRSRVGKRQTWVQASLSFRTLASDERLSLVQVTPHDQRAHQIRALFAQAGRPLAGDERFGKPGPAKKFAERFGVAGPLLHVWHVDLPKGVLGRDVQVEAPIPETFATLCEAKSWTLPEAETTD